MTPQPPSPITNSPSTLYSIGEAADILCISIPTIRMYEREGLIIPSRKGSKHRRFSHNDMERIRGLRSMINIERVSIAEISRMLSLIPCWKIKNCPDDARSQCAAFVLHEKPCWMLSGKSWRDRSERCKQCIVYTNFASCQALEHSIKTNAKRKQIKPLHAAIGS